MTSTDLITLDASTLVPAVVFAEGGVDRILADLTRQVRTVETDISTPQGRADIKSLAYKIARSKTALDSAGKQLGEDWRKRVDGINADRRRIRDELDALADEVRAPLTAWENAERDRIMIHENTISALFALSQFDGEPEIPEIERRIDSARHLQGARDWQEFTKRASDTAITVIADLMTMRDHWTQVYADRAEAERLRQEEAARAQRMREATIAARAAEEAKREAERKATQEAAEAAERARRQREAAEEKARQERQAIEAQALAERMASERAAQAAADRARREREELEAAAKHAEAAAIERHNAEVRAREKAEQQARIAEARRRDEAAAASHAMAQAVERAERDRRAAVEDERARVAEVERQTQEQTAKREADRKHKAKVHREARDAIFLGVGTITQDQAEAIISVIARGMVPHVRIEY